MAVLSEKLSVLLKGKVRVGKDIQTDTNMPYEAGNTYYTCPADFDVLENLVIKNPDYFKENHITHVRVLSNEDYNRMIRKKFHIDEMCLSYVHNKVPTATEVIDYVETKQAMKMYRDRITGELFSPRQIAMNAEKGKQKKIYSIPK